jgi:hypothetical protein
MEKLEISSREGMNNAQSEHPVGTRKIKIWSTLFFLRIVTHTGILLYSHQVKTKKFITDGKYKQGKKQKGPQGE